MCVSCEMDSSRYVRYSNCVATLLNLFTSAFTPTHTHIHTNDRRRETAHVVNLGERMAQYFTISRKSLAGSTLSSTKMSGHL